MEPFETLFSFSWWVYVPILLAAYVSGTFATSVFCGWMTGKYPKDIIQAEDHYGNRLPKPTLKRSEDSQKRYSFWKGAQEFAPAWPFMGIAAFFYLVFHNGFYANYTKLAASIEERQNRLSERARDKAFREEHDRLEAKEEAFLKDDTGKVDPLTGEELRRIGQLSEHLGIQKAIEAPKKIVVSPDEIFTPRKMTPREKHNRRNFSES